jgi:hypothetical protein
MTFNLNCNDNFAPIDLQKKVLQCELNSFFANALNLLQYFVTSAPKRTTTTTEPPYQVDESEGDQDQDQDQDQTPDQDQDNREVVEEEEEEEDSEASAARYNEGGTRYDEVSD